MAFTNPATSSKPWWHKWYDRQIWRGPNGLRYVTLARDPVCMMCHRNASTVADHIKPHKGVWELFCDLANLQGICDACHDRKTALEDGGFGNQQFTGTRPETNTAAATGSTGKQFQSSSIAVSKLDEGLNFDVDDLLSGIPE